MYSITPVTVLTGSKSVLQFVKQNRIHDISRLWRFFFFSLILQSRLRYCIWFIINGQALSVRSGARHVEMFTFIFPKTFSAVGNCFRVAVHASLREDEIQHLYVTSVIF